MQSLPTKFHLLKQLGSFSFLFHNYGFWLLLVEHLIGFESQLFGPKVLPLESLWETVRHFDVIQTAVGRHTMSPYRTSYSCLWRPISVKVNENSYEGKRRCVRSLWILWRFLSLQVFYVILSILKSHILDWNRRWNMQAIKSLVREILSSSRIVEIVVELFKEIWVPVQWVWTISTIWRIFFAWHKILTTIHHLLLFLALFHHDTCTLFLLQIEVTVIHGSLLNH